MTQPTAASQSKTAVIPLQATDMAWGQLLCIVFLISVTVGWADHPVHVTHHGEPASSEQVVACRNAVKPDDRCSCTITGPCQHCSDIEMAQHTDEHFAEWCHQYGKKEVASSCALLADPDPAYPVYYGQWRHLRKFSEVELWYRVSGSLTCVSCHRIIAEEKSAYFHFQVRILSPHALTAPDLMCSTAWSECLARIQTKSPGTSRLCHVSLLMLGSSIRRFRIG